MTDQKPKLEADFAADFREGETMAREWLAGKGTLPDLLHMVRDMPRGGEMGGLEAGFLATVDASVRGRRGAANAPDPAKARQLIEAQPSPEPPPATVNLNEVWLRRQRRNREQRLDELLRRNQEAFVEQAAMLDPTRRF